MRTPSVDEVRKQGGQAVAALGDIATPQGRQALVDTAVSTFGGLDVLVNNAGIETRQDLLSTTEQDFDRVITVNLRAAYFLAQSVARWLVDHGKPGVILNVSSVHEDWPMPGNTAYCVSKGGMRMMARTAGVELGRYGIRVVNLAPGAVDTPINASTESDPAKVAALDESIPLGRIASPQDIAATAVFLVSDEASYLTATTVTVDGGISQYAKGL